MDVKLGTAPNFVIVINNTSAWDNVGSFSFTSAQLNTTSHTNVSIPSMFLLTAPLM